MAPQSSRWIPAFAGMTCAGAAFGSTGGTWKHLFTSSEFRRWIRTLTLGLLTPFYFIRAGSFVSVAALAAAPLVFLILLASKRATKFSAVYPVTKFFGHTTRDGMYTTFLMSTGLTFGSISALFGLSHGIITTAQYSYIVATVVASAVVPTLIANAFFLPRHLLKKTDKTAMIAASVQVTDAEGQGETR